MTRPVEEIRADLEHPHTAALTALHSTTVGDGPIGRLLRDVEPLLHRLASALADLERARIRCIDVSNYLWAHIGELHQDRADLSLERDAALARTAAVEAQLAGVRALAARLRDYHGGFDQIEQERKDIAEVIDDALALSAGYLVPAAASPTPTGPEPERVRWVEHERASLSDQATNVVAWVKANGGDARYEPSEINGSTHVIRWPTPSIAVRTPDGWAYAAPGDWITKTSDGFHVGPATPTQPTEETP
jgi:hypothetical protein